VVAGDGTLIVTWLDVDDGGSEVVEYSVQRRLAGTLVWPLTSIAVPGDQLVHRYTGLTNGLTYEIRVRAVNVVGTGAWSVAVAGSPRP
jgi:titin